MPVSKESELLDRIEDMEDAHEDSIYRHKKELNEQVKEFLEDLHSFRYVRLIGGGKKEETMKYVIEKWEKKLGE